MDILRSFFAQLCNVSTTRQYSGLELCEDLAGQTALPCLFAGADLGLVMVFALLVAALVFKPLGLMGQA